MESNELNLFSRIRGIVKQDLEHLFITSSNSHFVNTTNLEQYLTNTQEGNYLSRFLQSIQYFNESNQKYLYHENNTTTVSIGYHY